MPTDMMRSERNPEGLALVATQLGALWNRQSRGRRLLAMTALLAVAGALGWTAFARRAPSWATVVTAHHDEESRECVAVLQRAGIAVRAHDRDIDVPTEELGRARQTLAAAGLPDAGVGLRSFDETSFLASGFAEQVSYKRALQDELARSIKGLAPVDGARVHLALGHRSLFKDRDQRPTASVALRLRPGQPLSAGAVRGIRQLVVGSVEGLRAEDVSVIDHLGNLLDDEAALAGRGHEDSQEEIEQAVSAKVRGLLERMVGPGNVVVVASAELAPRRAGEAAVVAPAPAAAAADPAPGGASTPEVAPVAPAAAPAAAPATGAALSEAGGEPRGPSTRLRRLQLAVVVDTRRGRDGAPVAPSPEEMERWTQLVRSAAGLDERRGDRVVLQAAPFAARAFVEPAVAPPVEEPIPLPPQRVLIGGAAALLLVILGVPALVRRRYQRRLREAERRAELSAQQAAASERRAADAAHATQVLQGLFATAGGAGAMGTMPGTMPGSMTGAMAGTPGGGVAASAARRPAVERVGEVVRRDLDSAAMVLSAWLGEGRAAGDEASGGRGESSTGGTLS
jgi:flagellar M-ring protein FliF